MKYFRSTQYPIEFVLSEHINKNFSSHNHANHYIISLCIKGSVTATLKNKSLNKCIQCYLCGGRHIG